MKLRSLRNQTVKGIIPIIENSQITIQNTEKYLEYGKIYLIKEHTLPDSEGISEVLFEDSSLFEIHQNTFEVWDSPNSIGGPPPDCGCKK